MNNRYRKSSKPKHRRSVIEPELPTERLYAPRDWSRWEKSARLSMSRAHRVAGL